MSERTKTPFGDIFPTQGRCKDDYPTIITFQNAAGQLMRLQAPAMRAFLEAERLNGRKLPWRKHRRPKAIRITGEGWRSCASQASLYRSDPGRFADPASSRHCRGLAVDVYNTPDNLTRRARRALQRTGWRFAVAGEPWHASYWEAG